MDWALAFCIVGCVCCVCVLLGGAIEADVKSKFERRFIERARKGWNAIGRVTVDGKDYIRPEALPLLIEEALSDK